MAGGTPWRTARKSIRVAESKTVSDAYALLL